MEYLDGCTLSDVLKEEKRLPVSWTVDIVEQIASALDEAHRLGMVHRDLKPENVWLEPNRRGGYTVKVLDFGLVKLGDLADPASSADRPPRASADGAEEETVFVLAADAEAVTMSAEPVTRFGAITGTPMYMSPEQCRGDRVDPRSDIYSLGAHRLHVARRTTAVHGRRRDADAEAPHRISGPPSCAGPACAARRSGPGDVGTEQGARGPAVAGGWLCLRAARSGTGEWNVAAAGHRHVQRAVSGAPAPVGSCLYAVVHLSDRAGDIRRTGQCCVTDSHSLRGPDDDRTERRDVLAMPALVTPIVYAATVAPLRPTAFGDAWTAVRRRRAALLYATAWVVVLTAASSMLLILPGMIVAISYVVYAPVVVMEEIAVRDALRRARRLARRAWSTVLIITALQFALPVLVWFAAVDPNFVFRVDENWQPKEISFALSASWASAMYQLLGVFVAPLTATMTALLLPQIAAGGWRGTACVCECRHTSGAARTASQIPCGVRDFLSSRPRPAPPEPLEP